MRRAQAGPLTSLAAEVPGPGCFGSTRPGAGLPAELGGPRIRAGERVGEAAVGASTAGERGLVGRQHVDFPGSGAPGPDVTGAARAESTPRRVVVTWAGGGTTAGL